jgi:hypothetical protein
MATTAKTPRTAKVYLVTTPQGRRLVRALTGQSAIKHVVLGTHDAKVATQDDLIAHLPDTEIEDAGADTGTDADLE